MLPRKPYLLIFCSSFILLNVACQPAVVKSEQESAAWNNPDDLLNVLDPEVTTEEQALAKGEQALSEGKTENALFYFIKALQFNKANINVLQKIAAIHQAEHHQELAIKVYQDILVIDSKNLLANEYLGLYYLEQGQIAKAKSYLEQSAYSGSWKVHNGLGIIADLDKNYSEAIGHYQAALDTQANNPMLLNNLGYSYYLSGDEAKARDYFNKALNIDSRHQRAIYNLALLDIKHEAFSEAIDLFSRIMPVHEAYNNVGYICMLNQQYDAAEEFFRAAVDKSPVYFSKAEENLRQLLIRQQTELTNNEPSN